MWIGIDLVGRTEMSPSIWQIVFPRNADLYPAYKHDNQTRGGFCLVCAWLDRSTGHVDFPKSG